MTHFQDAGKRPKKPGEENPWMGFRPRLGERDSDDGQSGLWCDQTSGMQLWSTSHLNGSFCVQPKLKNRPTIGQLTQLAILTPVNVFRRCLSEVIMFSYSAHSPSYSWQHLLFFSNKYSSARPESRIVQVALKYNFNFLWFWKHNFFLTNFETNSENYDI